MFLIQDRIIPTFKHYLATSNSNHITMLHVQALSPTTSISYRFCDEHIQFVILKLVSQKLQVIDR